MAAVNSVNLLHSLTSVGRRLQYTEIVLLWDSLLCLPCSANSEFSEASLG